VFSNLMLYCGAARQLNTIVQSGEILYETNWNISLCMQQYSLYLQQQCLDDNIFYIFSLYRSWVQIESCGR